MLVPSRPRVAAAACAGYGLAALADTALAGSGWPTARRWRMLTKPLLMPALATAHAAAARPASPHGARPRTRVLRDGTTVGLALSWLGDVALLGRGERSFLAGVGCFLGAHVAYTAAFTGAGRPATAPRSWRGAAGAATAFVTLAPVAAWGAGRRRPALRAPVVAYAAALCTTVAASTRLDEQVPPHARRTLVAGTTLFLVSDSVLAARELVLDAAAPPWVDAVVMATYTAAQGLIASGVSGAVHAIDLGRADGARDRKAPQGASHGAARVTAAAPPAPGPR